MKAPRPTKSDPIEREYTRQLLVYERTYRLLVRQGLKDLMPRLRKEAAEQTPDAILEKHERMDADSAKAISDLFDAILGKLEKSFPEATIRRWAKAMAERTHKMSAKNQAKHLSKATQKLKEGPVEITGILTNERRLSPYFKNIVDQNVEMIRSIPKKRMPAFKNGLINAINQDLPVGEISKMIQKNFNTTEYEARFLARDQIGKLNGALDEYHQKQIGVKRYIWRTMEDGAVRHDHELLDGTTQRWDRPPIVNKKTGMRAHPKDDYQCRCYAEAVLEDILDGK